jgi:hypothetical protein
MYRPLLMRPLLPEHRLLWVGFVGFGLKTGVVVYDALAVGGVIGTLWCKVWQVNADVVNDMNRAVNLHCV